CFVFSSRRGHTRFSRDWSSDVCSSDLRVAVPASSSAPATSPSSSARGSKHMGHKVHPTGIRLGIAKDWNSKWYAGKKEYAEYLRSEERRVGKECSSRWARYHDKNNSVI